MINFLLCLFLIRSLELTFKASILHKIADQ